MDNGIYASLDIGTTSIKIIVSEFVNGRMNIIGVGNERSKGLSRGIIVDIDQTAVSIKKAVKQAEEKTNKKINEVIVSVPSFGLEIEHCHGMVKVSGNGSEITEEDVQNVLSAATMKADSPERERVTLLPEEFIVDGFDGIRDPRGMVGVRLELHALLLSVPKTIMHNIRKCVRKAGLSIRDVVLQPLAIGSVALSEGERDFGVVLIDIGGGQTTAAAIHDDQVKFSTVSQEGGEYITKDISIVLNTSIENAERIKRKQGYAIVDAASEEKELTVEVVGQQELLTITEDYLAEIIEARLEQIFVEIKEQLDEIRALELPGGVVLTGGTASMPGVKELAEDIFGVQVEVYIPDYMGVRHPSFTTAIGTIQYFAEQDEIQRIVNHLIGTFEDLPETQRNPEKERIIENTMESVEETAPVEPKVSFWERIKHIISSFFD